MLRLIIAQIEGKILILQQDIAKKCQISMFEKN